MGSNSTGYWLKAESSHVDDRKQILTPQTFKTNIFNIFYHGDYLFCFADFCCFCLLQCCITLIFIPKG